MFATTPSTLSRFPASLVRFASSRSRTPAVLFSTIVVAYLFLVRCMVVCLIAVVLSVIAVSSCDKFRSFVAAEPWKWSASEVAETKQRGDVICHAIDAYRAKKGKYPPRLEDLQPEFLPEIPQPIVGHKQWEHMLIDQGTNYWLDVVASEFGPSLDKNAGGHWQYMDDDGMRDI